MTVLKGFLTVPHLYVGGGYHLDLYEGERALGTYPFVVAPPEGALESRFVRAEMYGAFDPQRGPSDPRTTFTPTEPVIVAGFAQLGRLSWLDAKYTVGGQERGDLTLERLAPQDMPEGPFVFVREPPEGGWPIGSHAATIVLDEQDVAVFPFTVEAS